MAWVTETDCPDSDTLYSTKIIGNWVFVISRTNGHLFAYNFQAKAWISLGNVHADMVGAINSAPLWLENTYKIVAGAGGRYLYIYNILTGTWTKSSAAPLWAVGSYVPNFKSMVALDDGDTVYVWMNGNATNRVRIMRYVISTDTWTQFTNDYNMTTVYLGQAWISDDHDRIHGTLNVSSGLSLQYTISTDAYLSTSGETPASSYQPLYCQNPHGHCIIAYNTSPYTIKKFVLATSGHTTIADATITPLPYYTAVNDNMDMISCHLNAVDTKYYSDKIIPIVKGKIILVN